MATSESVWQQSKNSVYEFPDIDVRSFSFTVLIMTNFVWEPVTGTLPQIVL